VPTFDHQAGQKATDMRVRRVQLAAVLGFLSAPVQTDLQSEFGAPILSAASHFVVELTMHKVVSILAATLGVLANSPSGTVAAERAPVTAKGTWTNVTPSGVDLVNEMSCGNYGSITMVADPARPSDLYTQFHCQGVWKSSDYGLTWSGPINTGRGGAGASGAAGLAIARGPDGQPPILYSASIRGTGVGFWKSTDGGVSWTNYRVAPGGNRQDFYPPVVNPYDPNHLLMTGHHMSLIVQSVDGGRSWSEVPMADGMKNGGGTGSIFFIDTGRAETTTGTWLWTAEGAGGKFGTWRTSDSGRTWTYLDSNEHPHGQMQIYQPDNGGTVFMPAFNSGLGAGVLRSTDYGKTWTRVGIAMNEGVVFGTPKRVYAMWAWACGGCELDTALQSAPQPGISGWVRMSTPPEMPIGAAQTATVFDGTNYIILTANWRGGLWRFVE
jgi:hypothetical protein